MTEVTRLKDGIKIRGHANYGKYGEDIVCSAVSTLVQTLILAVEKLTEDEIKHDIRPGKVDIKFWCLSESSKVLIDAFFLGIAEIAEIYPDNVRVTEPSSH